MNDSAPEHLPTRWRRTPFRTQFLSSIWIVPLTAILIVGPILAWVAYDKYQLAHEAEYRLLAAHARYADTRVSGAFHDVTRLLGKIGEERQAAQSPLAEALFANKLAGHLGDLPEINTLFVTDSQGQIVFSSDPTDKGRHVDQQNYFKIPRQQSFPAQLYISRPLSNLQNSPSIALTLPLLDTENNFAGIVGATIDFRFFSNVLQPVDPSDSASTSVIFNRDGDLVYRRDDPKKFFGRNIAKDSLIYQNHIRLGQPISQLISPSAFDGKLRLFHTRNIQDTGLSVIISRRQEEVLSEWQHNLSIQILIFIFTATAMLFLARVAQLRQSQLLDSTEALRSAKEKAEIANSAKGRFLAAASHDLRQPLHALSLLVSILRRRYHADSDLQIITPIETATQALKEMLDTLLDISKLDANIIVPQKQSVSFASLLARLDSEFRMQLQNKGLDFRIRPSTAHIYTDPTLLMAILRNLLTNAGHYTEHGGILLAGRHHQGQLLIQVWDTGHGISAAEQEKIFDEYYQVSNPERDRNKGLGLGLSIVNRVATLLEHPLRLSSRLGRGTMFEVSVPLCAAASLPTEVAPTLPALSSQATILVIDDDPLVRQGTSLMLTNLGYLPLVVDNAREALEKLAGQPPDLIVADYRLRDEQTGITAIAEIRASMALNIPAILVSGDTLPARLHEAKASAIELLHKPVLANELDSQIKRLLSSADSSTH